MEKLSKEDKKDFLEKVQENGDAAKAALKLSRTPVEVMVNNRQSELDLLELDELTIKTNVDRVDKSTPQAVALAAEADKALAKIAERRSELEKETTRAYLVPLTYRDSRIVQTAIAEALLSVEGMGFDDDTKIVMVLQEKKMMTVYLALRQFSNYGARYYKNLEEIADVSERTITSLYDRYVTEFELTDAERKN